MGIVDRVGALMWPLVHPSFIRICCDKGTVGWIDGTIGVGGGSTAPHLVDRQFRGAFAVTPTCMASSGGGMKWVSW